MGIVIALFAGLLIGGFTSFIITSVLITERIAERENNYDETEMYDIHDL